MRKKIPLDIDTSSSESSESESLQSRMRIPPKKQKFQSKVRQKTNPKELAILNQARSQQKRRRKVSKTSSILNLSSMSMSEKH